MLSSIIIALSSLSFQSQPAIERPVIRPASFQHICPLYQYKHDLPAEEVEAFCRQWERENGKPPSGGGGGIIILPYPDSGCDSPRLCKNDV